MNHGGGHLLNETSIDIDKVKGIRQKLHSIAELSGEEEQTARYVEKLLKETGADNIQSGIGGNGIIATYLGTDEEGEEIMFRAELDALPIPETINPDYASVKKGTSHKCGHDGHMAILLGLAELLKQQRPKKGKVHLLFQPSEETGQGAQWMIEDPEFQAYQPDFIFALHNLPGYKQNTILLRDEIFASASTGFIARLEGKTSHAGHPEDGNSPAPAISSLIDAFNSLPSRCTSLHRAALVTVIHARLGEVAFGTTPGYGEVMATMRSYYDEDLENMLQTAQMVAEGTAGAWGLHLETETTENFKAVTNDAEANALIRNSAGNYGSEFLQRETPFPWSEDFGRFTELFKGALFGIGSGEKHPQLHHRQYDFPDAIIEKGMRIFSGIIDERLNGA